jgi:hypothetical protein
VQADRSKWKLEEYIYIVAAAADLTDSGSMGDQSLSSPNNAQKL